MGAVDEILAGLPLDQLAAELGADVPTTEEAVREAVPSLFAGLQANVADPQGALGLAQALTQHADNGLLDGGVNLGDVDVADGAKIVQHIFGSQPDQIQALGGRAGGSLMSKLLPILAPIVMSYIAKRLGVGSSKSQSSGGGLGDLLGPILGGVLGGSLGGALGGGSQQNQTQSGGGDIFGQILGQVLGGGSQSSQESSGGGGLGDILGQILGGGGAAQDQSAQVDTTDSPFKPYPGAPKAGEPQIDVSGTDEQSTQQQQGGGLGDILGQIFGR